MRTILTIISFLFVYPCVIAQTQTTSASKELASLKRNHEVSLDRLLVKSIKAGDVAAVTEVSLEIDRITPGPPEIEKGAESPAGHWKWFSGSITLIYGNGLVSNGETKGIWKWVNKSKKEIQIKWSSGYIDTITIAPDGKSMQGTSNENHRFKAELVTQEN